MQLSYPDSCIMDAPVWLSTENQYNYKAAYDLAVQTGGETLPVTFKFGSDEQPEYHTFEKLDESEGLLRSSGQTHPTYTGRRMEKERCMQLGIVSG